MSRSPKSLLRVHPSPDCTLVPLSSSDIAPSDGSNVVGIVGLDSPIRDERALVGLQSQYDAQKLTDRTRAALDGADVTISEETLHSLVLDIKRANSSYQDAFESALDTGRCLNRIQHVVGVGGYKALLGAGVVIIGEASASKFRRIASAIDTGRIPPDLIKYVPRNPSGAYLLSNLPRERTGEIIRALKDEGLLPDGSIRALEQAVKRLKGDRAAKDLHRELARRQMMLSRLLGEVEKLKTEIGALTAACRKSEESAGGKDEPDVYSSNVGEN